MKIGFIGVGNMGWPMAANLVAGGFGVTAFDARPEQAARWAKETGRESTTDLAALGRSVDVVITMLPSGREVRDVLTRMDNGALVANLRKGAIVVDMSTADPVGTRELGKELAERGITLIDAPVSGGIRGARDASLAIMIGGDPAITAPIRPVLEKMGKRLFDVGVLGCGHAMKALNNFVAATNFAAATEAMRVGTAFGLDPAVMIDVINVSSGRNNSTEGIIKNEVLTGRFAFGFTLGLLVKDVSIAASLGEQIGVDNPYGRLTRERYTEARDTLGANADHSSAVQAWEKRR
ncbi:MAG: NAD(P)-dependent oxidoreductase [Bradyrhizobiaceae bacterium]|nr:NAD(P)-dependent oxidoreductase [Bradyrhizobiaceae bacterium]